VNLRRQVHDRNWARPDGHGSLYEPTPAGRDLQGVLDALAGWAERWMELTHQHADPDFVLWSWCQSFVRHELLPDRRVVVRFEFARGGRRVRLWQLIQGREVELCRFDPGFGEDLIVRIEDPLAFARWHMGLVDWAAALRSGGVQVSGPRALGRALPTWNAGPEVHARLRADLESKAAATTAAVPAPTMEPTTTSPG
jgi:hypothetical protein